MLINNTYLCISLAESGKQQQKKNWNATNQNYAIQIWFSFRFPFNLNTSKHILRTLRLLSQLANKHRVVKNKYFQRMINFFSSFLLFCVFFVRLADVFRLCVLCFVFFIIGFGYVVCLLCVYFTKMTSTFWWLEVQLANCVYLCVDNKANDRRISSTERSNRIMSYGSIYLDVSVCLFSVCGMRWIFMNIFVVYVRDFYAHIQQSWVSDFMAENCQKSDWMFVFN